MGTSLDGVNAQRSLTERRHANLPSFELPPPPSMPQFSHHLQQKFPSLSTLNVTQATTATNVGNLLTPPSNSASESSNPLQSASTPTHQGIPSYTTNYWQSGSSPGGYSSGIMSQSWNNHSLLQPRAMFSPSLNTLVRNTSNTSGASDAVPPPPYDLNSLPPFQASMSMPTPSSAPPTTSHAPQYSSSSMHSSVPVSAPTPPIHTPGLYHGSSSTSQAQSYIGYGHSTSSQQSPHSASTSGARPSPPLASPGIVTGSNPFARPPYPSYNMPGMPGPIMSNMHSPNGPMSMVGNMPPPVYNSGYAANAQQMYGAPGQPHGAPQQPSDRPFKCDQCTQSFNRNHDLKRHRRIHLAVKPFPCSHCDKSFSRKDALKRHILVKGCGNRSAKGSTDDKGMSLGKTESMSDGGDE